MTPDGPVAFAPAVSGSLPEPVCVGCGVTLTRFNRAADRPYQICRGCDAELAGVREEDA